MTWSYRVIAFPDWFDDKQMTMYGICEVYYHPDGTISSYAEPDVVGDSLAELENVLALMRVALTNPIILDTDFQKK